jgi:hypothetical protein
VNLFLNDKGSKVSPDWKEVFDVQFEAPLPFNREYLCGRSL